ncbi:hypothetical protein [Streptomyces sp. NPDC087437]|uniref:hypothetical protein n=1 Tax=Streptomyces sp. NPDC087437 TaxID=3365789 RepID=UPI00381C58AB
MNSAHPALATFRLVRDHDVSGISGEGVVAEGVQFSDGWVVTHWLDQPPMHEPKTDVWHHKGTGPVTKIHGHNGATRIVWTQDEARLRRMNADEDQAHDVPTALLDTAEGRAALQRKIEHELVNAATSATWAPVGRPEWGPVSGPLSNFVDAVMPVVDELLAARDRAQQVAGRAYLLADRWEAAHGSAMCLVRAAGAELREVLDSARDELDSTAACDHRLKPILSGIVSGGPCVKRGPHDEHETADGTKFSEIDSIRQPVPPVIGWTGPEPAWADELRDALSGGPAAAECSAQRRVAFEADPRECVRAAQHRGDHIDEQGYHWSDTVAVHPLADGTLRESPVAAVRRGQEYVSSRYGSEPEPQHDRPTSSCSNPDHVCVKCGDCAYEHPGQGGCIVGQLPPAEGRSVRTACTGRAEKRYDELRAESLRRGKENLTKAERIRALEAAVAELAQALRLTREYVGEDVLPAAEGWSWYDALRRHVPHEITAADESHADSFAGRLSSLKKQTADALAEGLAETVQRATQAEAAIERVGAAADAWERMPQGRYVYIHEVARVVRDALDGAEQPSGPEAAKGGRDRQFSRDEEIRGVQAWMAFDLHQALGWPVNDGADAVHQGRASWADWWGELCAAVRLLARAERMRCEPVDLADSETLCRLPHEMGD